LQEARKKNIKLAPYFFVYFDLKDEFLKGYPQARKPSLKQMVDRLGLSFVGRPHSGLDDSANVANVALKLLEYGHVFAGPELIPENYDPAGDPSFVDFNNSGGGKGPSIFSRLPEGSEEETTVLVIRGLPWSASEGEIEDFFGGAEGGVVEGGVRIIKNKNGRPSGVAYVEFESPEHTRQGLAKNNTYMGSRYIEVYLSDVQRMGVVLEGQTKIAERMGSSNGTHGVGGAGSDDVRPGDWRCPNCNDHQFASRTVCRKCGTAKPGVELTGHPLHPQGFANPFGQPIQQFHHQPFVPLHVGGSGGGLMGNGAVNVRPGDWHCPVCSDLNFASRKVCRKCQAPSPLAIKGVVGGDKFGTEQWGWGAQPKDTARAVEVRPGDWYCPGCEDLNFASRKVCRKCGTGNPSFSGPKGGGGRGGRGRGGMGGQAGGWPQQQQYEHKDHFRPGGIFTYPRASLAYSNFAPATVDWYCPNCSHLNFASREVCRQCGTAAGVDGGEDGGVPQEHNFGGAGWQ